MILGYIHALHIIENENYTKKKIMGKNLLSFIHVTLTVCLSSKIIDQTRTISFYYDVLKWNGNNVFLLPFFFYNNVFFVHA